MGDKLLGPLANIAVIVLFLTPFSTNLKQRVLIDWWVFHLCIIYFILYFLLSCCVTTTQPVYV